MSTFILLLLFPDCANPIMLSQTEDTVEMRLYLYSLGADVCFKRTYWENIPRGICLKCDEEMDELREQNTFQPHAPDVSAPRQDYFGVPLHPFLEEYRNRVELLVLSYPYSIHQAYTQGTHLL